MSKLNIDQKTVKELFSAKKTKFLIPDYQRPYAWGEVECQTLWDDIFTFAFPENDYSKFDSENDEYFLGPIVTYKNQNKLEIIDGQQRLTTLHLLLSVQYRACEGNRPRRYDNYIRRQSLSERNVPAFAGSEKHNDRKEKQRYLLPSGRCYSDAVFEPERIR